MYVWLFLLALFLGAGYAVLYVRRHQNTSWVLPMNVRLDEKSILYIWHMVSLVCIVVTSAVSQVIWMLSVSTFMIAIHAALRHVSTHTESMRIYSRKLDRT